MNWSDLEYIDFKINAKTGEKYYQQYLKPSYFLELYLRWTSNDEILILHQSIIKEIGHLFKYHHNSNKSSESRISDKEKIFNTIPEFLVSKKTYLWQKLSNSGGVGKGTEIGGTGDASLSYWIHKTPFTENLKIQQVQNYKDSLEKFDTDMLPMGIRVSKINICFPINHFKKPQDFFNWVMNNEFIKNGNFFSGSAGYGINFWEGYTNKKADEKLNEILSELPGLDLEIKGNNIGRVLNKNKTDFLPIVKRLNWLTFISLEGIEELGGFDQLKAEIEKNKISKLHQLKNGACIQIDKEPILSEKDLNFNQYYTVQNIISKLKFRNHPKDNQKHLAWFYKFEK